MSQGLTYTEGFEGRWYVFRTQAGKEAFGAKNLERQGFRVFMPQLPRRVRRGRRTQIVQRPLFPRYAFVALDLERQRWRSVLGTFGVSSLIMEGDRPRPVPRGVVESLRDASGEDGLDFRERLSVGTQVRFLTGPLADRIGELVALDDSDRVGILLEIMGASRVLTADVRNLVEAAL